MNVHSMLNNLVFSSLKGFDGTDQLDITPLAHGDPIQDWSRIGGDLVQYPFMNTNLPRVPNPFYGPVELSGQPQSAIQNDGFNNTNLSTTPSGELQSRPWADVANGSYVKEDWQVMFPVQDQRVCRLPGCFQRLLIVTNRAVREHLQREHPDLMYPEETQTNSLQCRWPGCYTRLKRHSLVKHMANTHLGAGECVCPTCRRKVSTPDALKRHRAHYCPGGSSTSITSEEMNTNVTSSLQPTGDMNVSLAEYFGSTTDANLIDVSWIDPLVQEL